tara:strand:+ start:343 stop:606 length:264 start_codon:yes stop_codon:yes gene_type:complete
MQKVFNIMAAASFLSILGLGGVGVWVAMNKDRIVEENQAKIVLFVTTAVKESITQMLPDVLDSSMPELPGTTGGVSGMSGIDAGALR